MIKKILIDARQPEETRVASINNEIIEDFEYEVNEKKQLKGNIYLARITRVEPSLQAAFVEYGGNRQGFLAFSEIHPDYYRIPVEDREKILEDVESKNEDDESFNSASKNIKIDNDTVDDEVNDVEYINILIKTLDQIESNFTPDIVFYDAGVDVHSNDDLGNLNLTDYGIKKRDEIVCEYFKEKKIPLCTVIGGGYSKNRQELASRHFSIFETVSKTYL